MSVRTILCIYSTDIVWRVRDYKTGMKIYIQTIFNPA